MRIGILGTGTVGQTLGTRLVQEGHDVRLGARAATNEKAEKWAQAAGEHASHGTFADAASFGAVLFNCTAGSAALAAVGAAGAGNMAGKILIDVSNPLDFSRGMPPTLTVCNTDSVGEQIQRSLPAVKVVKALNTVNASVMVDPGALPGTHDLFICGNDAEAKAAVTGYLRTWFGWHTIIDIGDISGARGMEMYLPLWLRLMKTFGDARFNVHVVRTAR